MFGDHENLKDTAKKPIKDNVSPNVLYKGHYSIFETYSKISKLISALYIVTEIIDKEEPIRLKLRTLGTEIISDNISISRTQTYQKVKAILSFLEIAMTLKFISEMNFNILQKEFMALNNALDVSEKNESSSSSWLVEFLQTNKLMSESTLPLLANNVNKNNLTNTHTLNSKSANSPSFTKIQRREDIIKAIKDNGGNATITDVKIKASEVLSGCSEKTLQRELISMVKDKILEKSGEKRWSRYSIKSST